MLAKYLGSNVIDLINLNLFDLYYINKSTQILINEEVKQQKQLTKK